MQTTNPVGQRRNNLAVLARAIWKQPGVSRRELVDRFEIDESSVSRLVGQLIDLGLVRSSGADLPPAVGPSPGGRRRIALTIRRDFGHVWGFTLWRDRLRVTVVDLAGTPLAFRELTLAPYDGDWAGYLRRAVELGQSVAAQLDQPGPLLGLGFGLPGWVDDEGLVHRSDEFGLRETPLPLSWPEGLPVLWENDANCGAWSGLGRGQPSDDELYVLARFLERGPLGLPSELSVGFGLVVEGKLHRGWRHNVGEFLSARWRPGSRSAFGTVDDVLGRCRSDDDAFREVATELLHNLRFASALLDPHTIHLGGDLKERSAAVLDAAARIPWVEAPTLLHSLPAGVDEVSLGAALLVLDELFQFPAPSRRTLFRGYGSGRHDPVWRGIDPAGLFQAPQ